MNVGLQLHTTVFEQKLTGGPRDGTVETGSGESENRVKSQSTYPGGWPGESKRANAGQRTASGDYP